VNACEISCGSIRRTFCALGLLASAAGGTVLDAAYGLIFVSCRPKAARVASMERWMYGASLSARLGWTVKFCTASG
jgi:hypothetical protein